MKELDPSIDTKVDRFNLDTQSADFANLLYRYDEKWNHHFAQLKKYEAQIKNLEDELKNLRQTLSFKARKEWKELEFDKAPSDKLAESWVYSQPEYQQKFEELKEKRIAEADTSAKEALYKNFHFQLLEKGKAIDLQFKMWGSQYFNTQNGEKTKTKEMEETSIINEMTNHLNKKRKKNV